MSKVTSIIRDLVALVADRNTEAALAGILGQPQKLNIRPVTWEIFVHPERDPGCFRRSPEFLSAIRGQYNHALVMFDRYGCGHEVLDSMELENDVESRLRRSGWGNCAAAVCLDPELECWIWSDSPHVERVLGWKATKRELRSWLTLKGLWEPSSLKPSQPKKAMEAVLRYVRKPRSSVIYQQLAENVSFRRCSDRAFIRLIQVLRNWFSVEERGE